MTVDAMRTQRTINGKKRKRLQFILKHSSLTYVSELCLYFLRSERKFSIRRAKATFYFIRLIAAYACSGRSGSSGSSCNGHRVGRIIHSQSSGLIVHHRCCLTSSWNVDGIISAAIVGIRNSHHCSIGTYRQRNGLVVNGGCS